MNLLEAEHHLAVATERYKRAQAAHANAEKIFEVARTSLHQKNAALCKARSEKTRWAEKIESLKGARK